MLFHCSVLSKAQGLHFTLFYLTLHETLRKSMLSDGLYSTCMQSNCPHSSTCYEHRRMSNGNMIMKDEFSCQRKWVWYMLIYLSSCCYFFLEEQDGKHKKSVRIASHTAETRSGDLLYKKQGY